MPFSCCCSTTADSSSIVPVHVLSSMADTDLKMQKENALEFLGSYLQIIDVEKKLESNRVELLNELMRTFLAKVPYQNLKLLATNPNERRILTTSEIIDDVSAGLGGTCYGLNIFLNQILRALGFDAVIQAGMMSYMPQVPLQHLINLVRSVDDPNDLYLVDPAACYPTLRAVSLHDVEPIYKDLFLTYKFAIEGDRYVRYHRKGLVDECLVGDEDAEWKSLYSFAKEPTEMVVINKALNSTYTEKTSGILGMLIFTIYPPGKAVSLLGNKFRVFDEVTQTVEQKELNTVDEICEALAEYWPKIERELVEKALENKEEPPSSDSA